jgi:hypothetical protein
MKLLLRVPNLAFLVGRRLIYGIVGAVRGRVGLHHLVWGRDIVLACVWEQIQAKQMSGKVFELYLEYWIQTGAFYTGDFEVPQCQVVRKWWAGSWWKLNATGFRGNNWNLQRKNAESQRAYPAALGSRVSSLYISTQDQ